MSQYFTTSIATGQWFYTTDADPNGVIAATRASVALRFDVGNAGAWINTNGATDWSRFLTVTSGGILDLTAVDQIVLADNDANALQIGSTGALNLLRFVTTNGAEEIQYTAPQPFEITSGGLAVNAGGITVFGGGLSINAGAVAFPIGSLDVAFSAKPMIGSGTISSTLELRIDYPAGAGPTDVVLPLRGLRATDARIIGGGAGGTVQVQTAGGASNVTNAMTPGAAVGDVTRALNIANALFAPGATIRVVGGAGTLAGTLCVTFEPV